MKKNMVLPLVVLASVPFIMVLGNSMLIPVFPQMEKAMDLSQLQVGLIITVFSIPAGLVIPFAGALSDHIGRKAVMAPALIIYGLGGLIAGTAAVIFSNPYPVILGGRVVQGIGAGGTYQLAMALTGDLFTTKERTKVLGYLEAANGMGKVLSPLLGSALALITWYIPFFAYGLLAVPIAFAVWFMVKEPEGQRKKQTTKEYIASLKKVFAKKAGSLLACYAAGAIGLFLLFGLLSFLSDELETKFNILRFAKGGVLAIPVGVMALASFTGGIVLESRQALWKPAIIAGLSFMTLGLALLPFGGGSIVPFVGLAALVAFGIGVVLPPLNTFITSATGPNERGLITCLYGTVRFFGVALGPPTFGLVAGMGNTAMFLGAAAIGVIGILTSIFWIKPKQIISEQDQNKGNGKNSAADKPRRHGEFHYHE